MTRQSSRTALEVKPIAAARALDERGRFRDISVEFCPGAVVSPRRSVAPAEEAAPREDPVKIV
jgi:hypothetical protein